MSYAKQFEFLIGELYSRKGFKVELNKTIRGRSGGLHEFDGYCVKGKYNKKVLVFEAKYSLNGSPVRLDDFSRFLTAVDDCKIPEAHLITNSYFSDNILSLAIAYNIKLIDGEELKKELKRYNLEHAIIRNDLSNVVVPLAKYFLNSIDKSKTLSRILLPSNPNKMVYLDLNPYSEFNTSLRKKFENQTTLSYEIKDQNNSIEKFILVEKPKFSFSDIGGLEEVKNELRMSIVYPTLHKELYEKFGLKPANVLLYGPPGCGKTFLAKAVANEARSKFITLKVSDIIKRYSSSSLKLISSIFDYAREEENCIVFLDELDVYMKRGGSSYDERIKNEFLQQLDGISSEKSFSLLGATNKPWLLDPAIRRPGRFDERIFVPPPDYQARKEILRIHMRDLISKGIIEGDVSSLIERIAEKTEGWSGADLKQLVEKSKKRGLLDLIRGRERKLNEKDFERVMAEQKPSTTPWFSEAFKACRRYGEDELLEEIFSHSSFSSFK